MSSKVPVAVVISGRGSNFVALAEAAEAADYPAEIVAVISDRADAVGLARAAERGIATHVVLRRDHPTRAAFDDALDAAIRASGAEHVCLAGFMRILGPEMVARWEGRMLNIHPSLLPAFKGLDTHQRALDAGAKFHGASVHLVTAELDDGPIVAQAAVPVMPDDDAESLAARVLAVEHPLYVAALAAHLGRSAGRPDATPVFNPPLPR
ncbi:phosphoribosylglycinamide formyltransferase [Acuticoccus mangrovi]|uniref:Phosphoribosylglycinamide formyltransferase n=1 Tax=Acuticoccus mangrovi TaxID=2796142 RepID=A0A934MHY9_9HYPH|nr:phosphoribosylglycinamide formyltransferase [Acuticoccus mangrovi]